MNLVPRFTLGALDLTEYPFAIEFGSDLGNPQNAAELVETLMQDGEIIASTRSSNREIKLPVLIEGADLDALAEAESSLLLECDKVRNTLTVDPGDGFAAGTQFDTFRTQVEFVRNDDDETTGFRRYLLTIPALPFGGSTSEITTVGVTSGATPTTVVISDGSSATSWFQKATDAGSESAATSTSGAIVGNLNAVYDHDFGGDGIYVTNGSLIYRPASPVDMSATTYLQVDWKLDPNHLPNTGSFLQAFADGVELQRLAATSGAASGYTRTFFVCPDASVSELRIKGPASVRGMAGGGAGAGTLSVDQVVRTNQAPSSGSLLQKVTTVAVEGSARTHGSLLLEHPTSALGYTIVHSYPDLGAGYTPNLRQYMTTPGGTVTTSAGYVSGARNQYAGTVYTVPLRVLRPGPYLLAAFVRNSTAGDYVLNGTTVHLAANVWQFASLGIIEVGDHLAGTSFSQTVTLASASSGVEVDEAWLFYVGDDASLTRINLGTGTPSASGSSNRLWLDTPTASRPYPSIWRGTLADKSDARNAVSDADAWEDISAQPPSLTVFTVTTNALDAQVSLTHRPRWHTHARRLS